MIDNYIQFFCDFEDEFDQLKNAIANPVIQAQELVVLSENKLKDLNKWLRKHQFETPEQEIYFFKILKPSIVSKIIYYSYIIKTESNLPINKKERFKYYQKKLKRIHDFTVENNLFYSYYRSNSSRFDNKYFIRNKFSDMHQEDLVLFNSDPKTSTSHDYLMAQMIASDLSTEWLENLIKKSKTKPSNHSFAIYTWTGTQTDLIEMGYGMYYSGAINHGNLNIKDFVKYVGKTYNIELTESQIYDTFYKIKSRKTEPAKFMNSIAKNLQIRILEQSSA